MERPVDDLLGDTKPERISIDQAKKNGGRGVTVFVHEMLVPAEIWAMQDSNLRGRCRVVPTSSGTIPWSGR